MQRQIGVVFGYLLHMNPSGHWRSRRTRTTAIFSYYVQLCGTFLGKHYFQLLAPVHEVCRTEKSYK